MITSLVIPVEGGQADLCDMIPGPLDIMTFNNCVIGRN